MQRLHDFLPPNRYVVHSHPLFMGIIYFTPSFLLYLFSYYFTSFHHLSPTTMAITNIITAMANAPYPKRSHKVSIYPSSPGSRSRRSPNVLNSGIPSTPHAALCPWRSICRLIVSWHGAQSPCQLSLSQNNRYLSASSSPVLHGFLWSTTVAAVIRPMSSHIAHNGLAARNAFAAFLHRTVSYGRRSLIPSSPPVSPRSVSGCACAHHIYAINRSRSNPILTISGVPPCPFAPFSISVAPGRYLG